MKNLRITEVIINGQIYPISPRIKENDSGNHVSVIIGNNATGKSRLLTSMLDCLRKGANTRLRKTKDIITLNIYSDGEIFTVNGENSEFSEALNLISISNSIFDKFPQEVKSDVNYAYVGTKSSGLSTHRKAIINDLMDVLSTYLGDIRFRYKAKELFSFIGLRPVIDVSLRSTYFTNNGKLEDLLRNSSTSESLANHLDRLSMKSFYRSQRKKILALIKDTEFLKGFHTYLHDNFHNLADTERERYINYQINLDHGNNDEFIDGYKYFSLLRQLSIITYDSILVHKGNISYDINDSSTGEIGLLTTFIRAAPHLRPNSIIFIDEPEISLHPSWQMRYIELLFTFLDGYTNCHVIIATHSHLILSDLKQEWSSIMTLRLGMNNDVVADLKDFTPFGWAPEAILYEVFGVATVRNQLFEHELSTMLELIALESDDVQEIKKYIKKFESFEYSEADPINLVIQEAKEYVAGR